MLIRIIAIITGYAILRLLVYPEPAILILAMCSVWWQAEMEGTWEMTDPFWSLIPVLAAAAFESAL